MRKTQFPIARMSRSRVVLGYATHHAEGNKRATEVHCIFLVVKGYSGSAYLAFVRPLLYYLISLFE
jgi:hypothetical protein